MLARLRPIYNQYILPLGKLSHKIGFTANFWTLFGLVMSIIAGILLGYHIFWWGLLFSVLMFVGDMLDGATARAAGTSGRFGMVFDHVIDRYAEMFLISGLLIGKSINSFSAMFSISGMIMASYVRAKAESAGGLRNCTVGIAGRAEKLFIIYVAIFLLALGVDIMSPLLWLVGFISHYTAIERLLYAKKKI
jgi:CDP-diacylglycerol--glycerol-3-phosphate 3-phosphatidyltransferase/archaetidylinositol phosphate synthase